MKKILFSLPIILILLIGCTHKESKNSGINQDIKEIQINKANHQWYYFDNDNYVHIDKLSAVPAKPFTAWTEQTRISSANSSLDTPDSPAGAYAIVNRLGLLCFAGQDITLSKDVNLFKDRTASNLLFLNNTPIFSVYKSSFFNDSITDPLYKNQIEKHLFLVQFDPATKISYPIINSNNLTNEINSEVTDFIFDGKTFYCSIKTISDIKNAFSYVKWNSSVPLLSISPNTAKDNINVSPITQDTFRQVKQQLDYKTAPERIKKLLNNFDTKLPFYIELKSTGGHQIRNYWNNIQSSQKPLNAKGIISESWSCVIFEDGTLFIEGALPGKHILHNGKPIAMRLPKLPANFVYSDFVISGTTLYVGWEESNFYKTARAGFLQVNLDKTLYSTIR